MSRVFAVDLGAWSVKLAIASPGLRGATLYNVVERPVPPGDEPAEVRAKAVLAGLVNELRLRDDPGYLGVAGDQVFTQILEFGFKSLRRAELDKAVGGELEGVVPVDLEDMVYTFEPLPVVAPPPVAAPGAPAAFEVAPQRGRVAPPAEGMRVLSYAMRRERAEHLVELGKDCGFDPRGLLARGGAAVRLVAATPSLVRARAEGAVAVIDIGHERTDVVVVAGGKAVFSRSVARAGKQVTEAIMRAPHWRLAWLDAERAKHSDGFVASTAEPATSPAWQQIHQVTITELHPFARDLRQTLAACRARTGFQPIAALLVGGGARLRGMASYLTEQLGIPAWRPTADDVIAIAGPRLGAEAASHSPIDSAAMTVGMAFDAAGGRPSFDLRSGSLAVKVDFSFLRAKAVPLLAALVAIGAFAAGSAYADLYRLRKAEQLLTTRLAEESAEQFGSAKSADQVLDANGPAGTGAASPMPRLTAYDLLLDISSHVPGKDKITLDIEKMTIDDQKIDINGTTKSAEEIDLLISEIKKIECFKNNVTRGPTDTLPSGVKRFKLTITAQCMGAS
ncbi:MAG TPA: pilus assembly protein PilM [Kofleriaceae bacterium]|jgi:Tfp pilus assembly PilM family ATPase|nr:pilus assembly protein PilM [Kofleriaceae bacterium]